MKKISLAFAAITLGCAVFMAPQVYAANIGVNIVIGNPPPPARYELVPAPRHGYLWVTGFWDWNGRQHVWVPGHWERARAGYVYQHPEWRRDGDRWVLERGRWAEEHHDNGRHEGWDKDHHHGHDRDHDGVPDRYDHHPNNPHRD